MDYEYTTRPNVQRLEGEVRALRLPGWGGLDWLGSKLVVHFRDPLSDANKARLDGTVAAHDATPNAPVLFIDPRLALIDGMGLSVGDKAALKKVLGL